MYLLYSLLLAVIVLLSSPWWILQMLRLGKYRAGFRERIGLVPARIAAEAKPGGIWIHAVSVGEVLAVSRLMEELRKTHPEKQVFVSTTTATGQQLARQRFGERHVFYMPLDFGIALRPYLRALRPALVILAETEFWPNLLHLAKKSGANVAIVNARISDRSFPRYRRFRWVFSRVLTNVDLFLAQTEEDGRRLGEIGAPADRVRTSGNLKFDIRLSAGSPLPLINDLRRAIPAGSPVIVAGSTTEGEEELLLKSFQELQAKLPRAVMILAARHPERFDRVANLATSMGVAIVRRSTWAAACPISGGVFLLDSVGELAAVYALADVAFVGGSLVPVGGHNILEPAQHGVAVLTGPHTFNFRDIVRIFAEGGGLRVVSADSLTSELLSLLIHPQQRAQLGQRAKELFAENTGATARTLQALQPLMGELREAAR
jgi:3-deoxy-D-manno-octulosonic-acid transferase